MPTTEQDKQQSGHEEREEHQLNAAIGKQVMHALGQPGDLHSVQVRHLWGKRYRVNVFVGVDAASAKVAHSYFLVATGDGNIIASTPEITKQY
jgi:hypothetical protein